MNEGRGRSWIRVEVEGVVAAVEGMGWRGEEVGEGWLEWGCMGDG